MKKIVISSVIALVIILTIVFQLMSNKHELDEAKKPVDRTKVPVAVKVSKAEKEVTVTDATYPAMLKPYEEAKVYAQASGIIQYLRIDLGSKVSKGQVVGELDTRLLKINLQDANISYQKALDDYERAKDLYENGAGLKVEMLKAKSNRDKALNQIELIEQQIKNARIEAPISGVVYAHTVKEGEFINPGTPIAIVSNVLRLKATAYVSQETVYKLQTGQEAQITSSLFSGKQISAEIIYISPVTDANHNYQVDLLVKQTEELNLRAGTDVQVSFDMPEQQALQVPKSALMTDTEEPYVFVVENKIASMRTVKSGLIRKDRVEVLAGLKEGETVVVTGQINLRDGSIVDIIN